MEANHTTNWIGFGKPDAQGREKGLLIVRYEKKAPSGAKLFGVRVLSGRGGSQWGSGRTQAAFDVADLRESWIAARIAASRKRAA